MRKFPCLFWSRLAVLFTLLIFAGGCSEEESAESESAITQVADQERRADGEEGSEGSPGQEIEAVPVLSATVEVLHDAINIEDRYEDSSLLRSYTIRTYTDFDRNNLAKGGWEFNGPYVEFHPNLEKLCEGNYADGVMTGQWTWWYEDGTMAKQGTFENGTVTGELTVWRPDGTLERTESYLAGKKHGRWMLYGSDGETPTAQHEYKDGDRDGVTIVWYPSGQKQQETHFFSGQLHGARTSWHENGQIRTEEHFRNGKPHGHFASWNASGTLQDERQYESGSRVTAEG